MDHCGLTFGFEVEPKRMPRSWRWRDSLKLRLLDYCATLCACLTFASGGLRTHIRLSRLKRRAVLLLDLLRGHQEHSPSIVPTGRERLIHLSEFDTESTGRDEDRPGRLLLGRFRESGLGVA
jgi:hypothetical protein